MSDKSAKIYDQTDSVITGRLVLTAHIAPDSVDIEALLTLVSDSYAQGQHDKLTYDASDGEWNSLAFAAVRKVDQFAAKNDMMVDHSGLPEGVRTILSLSRPRVETDKGAHKLERRDVLLAMGEWVVGLTAPAKTLGHFLAQVVSALGKMATGRARFQSSDLVSFLASVGPQAVFIVGLVNLLLGVILAFMGAVQLQQFGAQIFVANLVSLGLTREIAPMMTAIILAGRTGAAYAAQLGTMQVNEEIDALETFGFSPMEFLVLPRMVALAIMTPLLVLFADAIGMLGGFLVATGLLDIAPLEYLEQTRDSIDLVDIGVGVFKGSFYGVLVAIAGCYHGINSGRSALAVGDAATRAVVSGIVAIIMATAFFAVLTNVIGI